MQRRDTPARGTHQLVNEREELLARTPGTCHWWKHGVHMYVYIYVYTSDFVALDGRHRMIQLLAMIRGVAEIAYVFGMVGSVMWLPSPCVPRAQRA